MKPSLIALLVASSCVTPLDTSQPTPPLSPVSQPSTQTTSAPGAGLTPPTTKPASIPGIKTFTYEPWNIEMILPERAVTSFDPANQHLNINLSWKQTARCKRVESPLPNLTKAPKEWSWGDDLTIIEEGSLPNGAIYRIVTFEARVGFEGLPGQHIHRITTFSRASAAFPLGKAQHLDCSLHIEFDVSKDLETRQMAKELFSSITKK